MAKNSLSSFVKKFRQHIFSSDSKYYFANSVKIKVSATKRFLVTHGIKTAKDENVVKNQRKRREQSAIHTLLTEIQKNKRNFNSDLAEALLFANILKYTK